MAALDDNDLKNIKELIEVTFDQKLDEKLSHLPIKDKFYERTGEILKRLDNLEQEKRRISPSGIGA